MIRKLGIVAISLMLLSGCTAVNEPAPVVSGSPTPPAVEVETTKVPDVTGMTVSEAVDVLTEKNLSYSFTVDNKVVAPNPSSVVAKQDVSVNTVVDEGSTVVLELTAP